MTWRVIIVLLKITVGNNNLYKKMNNFKFKLFLFVEYFIQQKNVLT